jgi:hypothetical protein
MKTTVYIDGFNLYYGAVKDTPYRWLDVRTMCELLLPRHEIGTIKYFTARVRGWEHDPDAPTRQDTYLRALRTVPGLQLILGHFLTKSRRLPRTDGKGTETVRVTEEKGSDVNLAAHLVRDAFCSDFELAAVVSNDSDLAEAIRIVVDEVDLPVGILAPVAREKRRPSEMLRERATFLKRIRSGVLKKSQFPEMLTDSTGRFRKPSSW